MVAGPEVAGCTAAQLRCFSFRCSAWVLHGQRSPCRSTSAWLRPTPAGIVAAMRSSRGEIVRPCVGRQVGAGRDHAAADVDADRRRHECAVGGDHGADSGANADVRVGHERSGPARIGRLPVRDACTTVRSSRSSAHERMLGEGFEADMVDELWFGFLRRT